MRKILASILALALLFSCSPFNYIEAFGDSQEETEISSCARDSSISCAIERISTGRGLTLPDNSKRYNSSTENEEVIQTGVSLRGGIFQTVYNGSFNNVSWSLNADTGVLTISGSGDVYNGWYYNGSSLGSYIKTVNIGSGITGIQEGAFYQCANLSSVSLPSTLREIGFAAFAECSALKSISIPNSVRLIGEYAFLSCTGLKSITLPQSVQTIDSQAFADCESMTKAVIYGEIGIDAFNNCISLTEVSILGNPNMIGDRAFAYCISLGSVDIPASVTNVGLGAFAYCELLQTAQIAGNLGESAFDCCYSLVNVQFKSSCTSIGRRGFAECYSLTSVSIPDTVTDIQEAAFYKCTALKSVSLPDQLTVLGTQFFGYCEMLETVAIPASVQQIEYGVFGFCSRLKTVNIPNGCTELGEVAFYACKNLTSIDLPDSITAIGSGAFYQCEKLESISLPANLKTLGTHVFTYCSSLQSVTFGNRLEEIGECAFGVCHALTAIDIPESVHSIGECAFYDCPLLTAIHIPSGVTVVGEGMFSLCDSLETVDLPEGLTEIGIGAFFNCKSLQNISIPSSLTELGWGAFSGCRKLTSIHLPAGVTSIPKAAFMQCDSMTEFVIDGNLKSIGEYSFALCSSLQSLSLPNSVTMIDKQAFAYCESLANVNMPSSLKTIGEAAFFCCFALQSAGVGANVTTIGTDAFSACSSLESFTIAQSNHNFVLEDHALYTADHSRMISVLPGEGVSDIVIPETVTEIGQYAFAEVNSVRSVSLPASVTEISDMMFINCSALEEVSLPETITKIGAYAFCSCTKLCQVNVPETVTEIGEGAFFDCRKLSTIHIPEGIVIIPHGAFFNCIHLTEILLPTTLTEVDSYAFALCASMEKPNLPESITRIGEYAFAGCSALTLTELPSALTSMEEGAFAECDSLTSLKIPANVASVDNFVFSNCPSLTSVEMQGYVYAIGVGSFYGDEALRDVIFAGNAPEVIGENGFAETSEELLLHFDQAATGWELPQWTGPDGNTYRTSTVYSGTCGTDVRWRLVTSTGEMTIQGSGAMYDWNAPGDTPWNEYADMIRTVHIEEGVTSVGANAFAECAELVDVTLPATLTHAGYAAFANCLKLNEVIVEGGLKSVSVCMFYNDDQLWGIELSPELVAVSDYAFYGCCLLGDVIIPASVRRIGEGAFASCVSIEELTLKGKVDSIDTGAFFNCAGLSSVVLNADKPTAIGDYAFYGCSRDLTLIGSDDSSWLVVEDDTAVSSVSSSSFSGDVGSLRWSIDLFNGSLTISGSGDMPDFDQGAAPWLPYAHYLTEITVEEGVTRIGDFAFTDMGTVLSIHLPSTLQSAGQYAFARCTGLSELILPNGLSSLGEGVFAACVSLTALRLPGGITQIPNYMCSECYSLQRIEADTPIVEVGYGAFNYCSNLEIAGFLQGGVSVSDWAFVLCSKLSTPVKLSGRVGEYAFFGCGMLAELDLSNVTELGEYAFSQCGVQSVTIPGTIQMIPTSAFELCTELTSVVIQPGVVSVALDAFYGCQKLTTLDLGHISLLGDHAFMATGLTSVVLPNTLTEYGIGVFGDCLYLESIEAGEPYTSVDGVLYLGDTLLQFPAGKMVGSFTIPDFAASIADYAFYGCRRLVELNVGNQVSELGKASFALCEGLEEASLGSGITRLPEAVFGSDGKLSTVQFGGDAPTAIGEDAFFKVPEALVLMYYENADGWTEGAWVGPDGNTYHTEAGEAFVAGYSLSLKKTESDGELELVLCNNSTDARSLAIVVSAWQSGRIVATKTWMLAGSADMNQSLNVMFSGNAQAGPMSVEAFLLDAQTGAPMASPAIVSSIVLPVDASDYGKPNLQVDNKRSVVCSERIELFSTNDQNTRGEYGDDNDILPASIENYHPYTIAENELVIDTNVSSRAVDLDRPCYISTLQFKDKDFLVNKVFTSRDGGIAFQVHKSGIRLNIDGARALVGDYRRGNALIYADIKANNGVTWVDKSGNLRPPRVQLNDSIKTGFMSIGLETKEWMLSLLKIKYNHNVEILSAEGRINLDTDGVISASFQANALNYGYQVDITGTERGEYIAGISGNAGLGPGISTPNIPIFDSPYAGISGFTKDNIIIDISGPTNKKGWNKYGINANISIDFHPTELLNFLENEFADDLQQLPNAIFGLILETVDEANNNVDRIAFIRYTLDAERKIKDAWVMPNHFAWYLPGDDTYNVALPKSSGGTVMPTQATQITGGGSVSTNVPANGLTPAQQQLINQSIAAQASASVIPQSVSQQIINSYLQNIPTNYTPTATNTNVIINYPNSGGFIDAINNGSSYSSNPSAFQLHAIYNEKEISSLLPSIGNLSWIFV